MTRKKTSAGRSIVAAAGEKISKPKTTTKLSRLEAMLRGPEGATIEQMVKALQWQSHSVRGAIAGALKKKGCSVTSAVNDSERRIYRIA